MAKKIINSFNAGELSPYLYARTDLDKYGSGCLVMENFMPLPYGGATRRPAVEYKFDASSGEKVRLVPFVFSVSQSYLLVIGDEEIKIYQDTTLKDTIVAPWADTELDDLKFVQSADVMWFAHPDHPVQRLERNSDTDWSIADAEWDFPPLLDENEEEIYFDIEFDTTAWVTATDYVLGDRVEYNGVPYVCLYSHTSVGNFITDYRNGHWFPSNKGETGTLRAFDSKGINLTNDAVYRWQSGTGSTYYIQTKGGADPSLTEPDVMRENWSTMTKATSFANLQATAGTWYYGDDDGLGYSTIYVHIVGGTDPDGKDDDYLTALDYATAFTADLVGSQFSITNQRNGEVLTTTTGSYYGKSTDVSETTISYSVTDPFTTVSAPIYVGNSNWSVDTSSGTGGTLRLVIEKSDDYGETWDDYIFVGDTIGGVTKAFSATSDEVEPLGRILRLSIESTGTCDITFNVDSVDFTGFFTVDSYTSGNEVEITINEDVQKELAVDNINDIGLLATNSAKTLGTTRVNTWTEGAFSDAKGHPRCVALFENRLSFAGTSSNPDRLWLSQVDDYQNFLVTEFDTGALDLTLNSGQVDEIKWLVPQERLVIGTAGSEWSLGASDERKPITPTAFDLKRKTSYGSNDVQAILVNSAVLFLMRQGRKVREWTPNYNTQDYVAPDLSILAEHITDGGIVQWDYQQQPDNILWSIRNDGTLLGFTYERDQNVTGWHRHNNDEFIFESIAVLPRENEEDELWVSVNMGGARLIGQLNDREWGTNYLTEWQGSDLYVTYTSPGTDVLTGLSHLNGKDVVVVGDGVVEATEKTVSGGQITVDSSGYTTVVVGLAFTSTMAPVYPEIESQYGSSQGDRRNSRRGTAFFKDTFSAEIGQTEDDLEAVKFDADESALYTETAPVYFDNGSEFMQTCYIVQSEPMPCTVLAIMPNLEV